MVLIVYEIKSETIFTKTEMIRPCYIVTNYALSTHVFKTPNAFGNIQAPAILSLAFKD